MKEISYDLSNSARSLNRQLLEIRDDMFRVLVQDEYIKYFSDPSQHYGGGLSEEYHGLAKMFKQQVLNIYHAGFLDMARLELLSKRFCRVEGCRTVAYEKISDEELEKLKAKDIVTIYMGEIIHERWGGAFKGLFEHPFFLKSLIRLKSLEESDHRRKVPFSVHIMK